MIYYLTTMPPRISFIKLGVALRVESKQYLYVRAAHLFIAAASDWRVIPIAPQLSQLPNNSLKLNPKQPKSKDQIMSTITIRLPDTKHARLKTYAKAQNVSLNKLFEEWATVALAQQDAQASYAMRQSRGARQRGDRKSVV